jgi:hypothetical protein
MRQITFSEADVQAIAHERYHHPDPRVQRHMEILWLKHNTVERGRKQLSRSELRGRPRDDDFPERPV